MDTHTLSQTTIDAVTDLLRTFDEDAASHLEYSGRGMYGTSCVAWSANNAFLVPAVVAQVLNLNALEVAAEVETDSFGRGQVVYFRFLEADEEAIAAYAAADAEDNE